MKPRSLYISLLFILLVACSQEEIPDCTPSESGLYSRFSFPVGTVAEPTELDQNASYRDLVDHQFNSVTPENVFKPESLQPEPGQFSWALADSLAAYCSREGKRLHGHTLIWHQQLPYWMQQFQGTPAEWEEMMKIHIQTVVTHFKGQVVGWDVVNEAFEDDGTLRETIWQQHIGDSYIEKAFRYAHEANPSALLFYNDYNLASKKKKRRAAIELLNDLRGKGVRIDGIGLQMHISYNHPSNSAISKALEEVWEDQYLVHISELDISINPNGKEMSSPPSNRLVDQAKTFQFIFNTYQEAPTQYQYGITIWGVSDRHTWIRYFFSRNDYPLLFDDEYRPKPAYCLLMQM